MATPSLLSCWGLLPRLSDACRLRVTDQTRGNWTSPDEGMPIGAGSPNQDLCPGVLMEGYPSEYSHT
jgi:hypothetical protein